ncbi:MAG: DUF547 domain-containing protein [Myxococcota bacterium]
MRVLFLLGIAWSLALGAATVSALETTPAAAETPAWAAWDALLAEHTVEVTDVAGVRVDYAAIARDPRWPALLEALAAFDPPRTRAERLAFWINAYNVLAIDVVLQNRPLDSIRDAGSFLRPIWGRPAGRAAGRDVSLGEIEHEILRPLGDPRIHAAIVCASTSCPSLHREAFRAARLDAQLDAAVQRFLADPRKGARVTKSGDALRISKIFDWFEDDFEAAGGVRTWLLPRLPESERARLRGRGDSARLEYFEYDWSLNDAAR